MKKYIVYIKYFSKYDGYYKELFKKFDSYRDMRDYLVKYRLHYDDYIVFQETDIKLKRIAINR